MSEVVTLDIELVVSEVGATVIEVVEMAIQGSPGPPGDSRLPDPETVPDYYTFAAIGGEYVTIPFPAGTGGMSSLVYDPRGVADDAFNLANLTGALDAGVFT